MRILIVEDEANIREFIKVYLQHAGFETDEAEDGEKALELINKEKFDLIILDLNLPKIDGIEVCKRIRNNSDVPVIMLTARVEEMDELLGLEIGADDYIKKPFKSSILMARVKSLLRRFETGAVEIYDLRIDPEKVEVYKQNRKLRFTATQFNILYTLIKNPGKVFSRNELLDRAYDSTIAPDVLDRTIDAHIKSIRKQIETDTKNPVYIQTVIGKGYKFSEHRI